MKVAFWIYLFILLFAPLAFGTVELWSITVVEVCTGIAAFSFFLSRLFYKKKLVSVPGLVPLCLLLAFMLFQLIPLPASIVRVIAPASYHAYEPILELGKGTWIPLSINQHSTLQEFLRIGCYSLFYILTVQLLSVRDHLKKTVYIVIGLATTIGLLSIVQRVGSPDKIYWLRSVPSNASPFGPWINPNQFAGYMEMLCPLALALFLFFKPRVKGDESLRSKIVNFFTMSGSNLYMVLGFATCLISLSVFVSLCRGGILTIILSLFVFMLLYSIKKARQGRAALFAIVALVILSVSWFGWDLVFAEFNKSLTSEGSISDGRFYIWQDTLQIIGDFLLFGTGFGTFIDVFPSYMSFPDFGIIDHAHNDYLELLTDGGIIGFSLTAWFTLSVMLHGWKMVRARGDQYAVLVGIGALTGIIAMLMHCVTEFNMHNGADGLYFFFICGLLVTATNVRYVYPDTKTILPKRPTSATKPFLLLTFIYLITSLTVQSCYLIAQSQYNSVVNVYISKRLRTDIVDDIKIKLHKAITLAPLHYLYTFQLGSIESYFDNKESALQSLTQSARQNPMYGSTLQAIAFLQDDDLKASLLEKGYQRGLDDNDLALNYIEHLLSAGEREQGIAIMSRLLKKTPKLLEFISVQFQSHNFSQDEISAVLSTSISNWFNYGALLSQKEASFEEAVFYFNSALELVDMQEVVKPQWFHMVIRFYQKNEQPEQALIILRQAVETLPDDISFHLQLGDYFRKEGIQFRAKEEYERVLMLQPGNRAAVKRLRKMGLMDSY